MLTRILTTASLLSVFAAGAAFAHAYPQKESPAKGATLATAPTTLWIEFDDELEPAFTGVKVVDAKGHRVDQGKATVSTTDARHLSIGLKPLAPGKYTVIWHATDTDTHKTHGSYSFTVTG